MSGSGFRIDHGQSFGLAPLEKVKTAPSTQYTKGDMLKVVAGVATQIGATDSGTHLFVNIITPDNLPQQATKDLSTTNSEPCLIEPIKGGQAILRSDLKGENAPPVNGVACNSNATANEVLFTFTGSSGDFTNGTCYIPSLGQQRLITNDSVGGGVHTFTVDPAFSRAPTTGDTIIAVPYSKGATGVKFSSTTAYQGIDSSVAGKSGGNAEIWDVDLNLLKVYTVHR